jgi:4-hydroxyphenylpyruvate dioxygenase
MTAREPLGIKKLEAIHYYVHDLERSRRFYTQLFDFEEVGQSNPDLERAGRQRSAIFRAGDCTIVCSMPIGVGGRAWRYLQRHPDGVGSLVFEVEDIDATFRLLDERGGTMITDVQRFRDDGGTLAMFNITTPFGDTTFRFVERRGFRATYSGVVPVAAPTGGKNVFAFRRIDHVTSNFQTMKPALLWMEHVLGFEPYWEVEFHTADVDPAQAKGSGLKSVVMWDPHSGVKFANNEPQRPFFKSSQINIFNEELRGDGVQHVALEVDDILGAVAGLRARGVSFMPTPPSYYEMLPARIQQSGIGAIDEAIDALRALEVLIDGDGPGKYMLQIFLKENAAIFGDPTGGPFFYEIIQRKGDRGFGAGNFRALFESIEREQSKAGARGKA